MKNLSSILLLIAVCLFVVVACDHDNVYEGYTIDTDRAKAGGETTIFTMSHIAYGSPASNLSGQDLADHFAGDTQFEQIFVTAPASLNPGLGPIYNNSSCIKCHPSDGRGKFPENINSFSSFFYRLSIPGEDVNGGPLAVPGFGTQAQNHAILGYTPEMEFQVTWEQIKETLADGTVVYLRKPVYGIQKAYTTVPSNILISPRIAPPVFGLGLLEYIPQNDIISAIDKNDSNGDGIIGKANYVWNPITKQKELGRFGWKANTSSIEVQTVSAYHEDMGITSFAFPSDNPSDGLGDDPEITAKVVAQVAMYCRTLAVPAARDVSDISVDNGYKIFQRINCSGCHTPKQRTGAAPISVLANQIFYPFTDMLLHDMGDDLADNRPDFLATGKEWKTRPLWGIGLQQIVNGHTEYLHDGRARTITEAILWHGGEALKSKNEFKKLSTSDRNDLLKFLNSL